MVAVKKQLRKRKKKIYRSYLKMLVQDRRITPAERLANRLGYMGTAFIMLSPYLLQVDNIGVYTYIIGGIISIPQVWLSKHWNLVLVNINVILGYGIYLLRHLSS